MEEISRRIPFYITNLILEKVAVLPLKSIFLYDLLGLEPRGQGISQEMWTLAYNHVLCAFYGSICPL